MTETTVVPSTTGGADATKTTTTVTELKIGDNQISGPVAGALLLISEAAFFFSFLAANGAIIWNTLTDGHVEQASLDACRDIAIGSGAILAVIIVGQQLVTTALSRFIK